MANEVAETRPRSTGRSLWLAAVLSAFVLLAAAGTCAHRSPFPQADSPEQFRSISVGYRILVLCAMPWLLQWAGLALLVVAVARGRFRAGWADVLLGICLPLVVGLIWWVGVCAIYWTKDPFEAMLEQLMWGWMRAYGAESWWESVLFEVFGPLTCPLRLQGPGLLRGWDFLWTALSTALVMSTLTWVAWRLRMKGTGQGRGVGRRWLLMALYFSPVFVRALMRVLSAHSVEVAACW